MNMLADIGLALINSTSKFSDCELHGRYLNYTRNYSYNTFVMDKSQLIHGFVRNKYTVPICNT